VSDTRPPILGRARNRGDVRLTLKGARWFRFFLGIFLPGFVAGILILGVFVRFVEFEDRYVFIVLSLSPLPVSAALGVAYLVWFGARRNLEFSTYDSYLRPAIRLACLVLFVIDFLVSLAFYSLPGESGSGMHISLLVWLWLTPVLAIFGFPLLFVSVFFFMAVFFVKEPIVTLEDRGAELSQPADA
jgi:hypothetical protein